MKILIIAGGSVGAAVTNAVIDMNLPIEVRLVVKNDELDLFSSCGDFIEHTVHKFRDINTLKIPTGFDLGICIGWSAILNPKFYSRRDWDFVAFILPCYQNTEAAAVIAWQIEDRVETSGSTFFG